MAAPPGGDIAKPDDRERLRQHFLRENTPQRWDDLWKAGSFLPWDRKTPNPALIDVLETRKDLLGDPFINEKDGTKRKKKALVPGCGRGYDVYLLAAFGYDAYGLEGSKHAIEACEGLREELKTKDEYAVRDEKNGKGEVKFLFGDFFQGEWETNGAGAGDFDIVYDYTFLCALEPSFRPKWSHQMSRLLSPTGKLICLEFPTYKDPSTGGPPFALPPQVYEMLLPYPGEALKYGKDGHVVVEERQLNKKGLKRIAHWQPERTHEVGKGTDWIGVWQH
ncbi:S-adenosyl-L-methionine-dependent methyltransferase [Tothia fuscella]|uniref:S-adenosyl-L-methionine-dependent methyltransferase n=1 Tax=Tothia fuscella TaxID=1048955 RepID=A0A9P4U283_9PEZI|nr:S-adenosyl-L-methionine-dependent methyltransferase [Tothia fuscella]